MTEDIHFDETQPLPSDSHPTETVRRPPDQQLRAADVPERIGPYRILETLGEGGMGSVYLAEQEKPIHRRVALKVIKLGMDTKQVIARFEAEREALALMNHPNVAKVYDAGVTDQGRPYFAMEYVEGVPLTAYCDAQRLAMPQRLGLFVQVCKAIQHAHQKGIIHRDIKPSNVLVTAVDGQPTVKVIDFGIAKATQQRLTEATYFTEQGQLIGTPAYMSPEQADPRSTDIDTRTDVYSLGVLLYELLVGELPFAAEQLRKAALTEIVRIIREVDPPKPSTRLAALGNTSTTIADLRSTTRVALARQLRGDLDWIVMKCLEKDRTRRYETATALVEEIHRFLNHEAVLAGPPSPAYRLRKLIRRNRGAFASGTVVLLALAAGLVVSVMYYRRADQERQTAEAVVQFLGDALTAVDPRTGSKDVTMREVLDRAAQRIGEELKDQPLTEAYLRAIMASSYNGLGQAVESAREARRSMSIREAILGPDHPDTLHSAAILCTSILSASSDCQEAIAFTKATSDRCMRVLGPDNPDCLTALSEVGKKFYFCDLAAEAIAPLAEAVERSIRVLGERDIQTLSVMDYYGGALVQSGSSDQGRAWLRRSLEGFQVVLGTDHPYTLQAKESLAIHDSSPDDVDTLRALVMQNRRLLGETHPTTLMSMNNLAAHLPALSPERLSLFQEAYDKMVAVMGGGHRNVNQFRTNLYRVLIDQGHLEEAATLAEDVLVELKKLADRPEANANICNGIAYELMATPRRDLRDPKLALDYAQRAMQASTSKNPHSIHTLAMAQRQTGDLKSAIKSAKRALGQVPETDRDLTYFESFLAELLVEAKRFEEAEPLLLGLYDRSVRADITPREMRTRTPDGVLSTHPAVQRLVELYAAWNEAEPGKGYDAKAEVWKSKADLSPTK